MRYALYLLPVPASALWHKASALLGYDAASGEDIDQPSLPDIRAQALRAATEDPRRYGFHMTLKAPFRLAEGHTEERLRAALSAFCAARRPFDLGPLAPEARIGSDGRGFVCVAPANPCPELVLLEQETVHAFEPFRAPLTQQEVARRRPETLSPRQRVLLDTYGYPFVLDEFRPHFSLTGQVDTPVRWKELLAAWLGADRVLTRCQINGIALLRQGSATERFRLLDLAPLR